MTKRRDPRSRPTWFVALVFLPALLLFAGGGGAMAVAHRRAADVFVNAQFGIDGLEDEARVPNGAYVPKVDLDFTYAAHNQASIIGSKRVVAVWTGGNPKLAHMPNGFVFVGPVSGPARVCNYRNPPIDCRIPSLSPKLGTPERVLLMPRAPVHSRRGAVQSVAFAVAAVVGYVVVVLLARRRRIGGARISEEHTWAARIPGEEIAKALSEMGDAVMIVDEGPGRIELIQGRSESAARGWRIREAADFPRRVFVTWRSSPREPAQVTARIEEDLLWSRGKLSRSMERLARASISATRAQIERALVQA